MYEQTFEIKIIELHLEDEEKVLCVISDENEQEYIIGIDGLEIIIEDRKRLIQYKSYEDLYSFLVSDTDDINDIDYLIKNLILAPDFKRITNLIVDTNDILELNLSDICKELEYENIEDIKDEKLIRIIKEMKI